MPQPDPLALGYASGETRARRFRPMWVLLPFGGGLLAGLLVAWLTLSSVMPEFVREPIPFHFLLWLLGVVIWAAVAWPYSALAVFVACCTRRTSLVARQWSFAAAVGALLPLGQAAAAFLIHLVCVAAGGFLSFERFALLAAVIVAAVVALSLPFVLVRAETSAPRSHAAPRRIPRPAWWAAGVAAGLVALALARGPVERRALDASCAKLTAWVRATYPAPGPHPNLVLPARFTDLTDDGHADAVLTPDGRVVLLLKLSLGWFGHWTGVIWSTGPIRPDEMGRDDYGDPQVNLPGLSAHRVTSQPDSRHFVVCWDLGEPITASKVGVPAVTK